jgi:hypothetical protein
LCVCVCVCVCVKIATFFCVKASQYEVFYKVVLTLK